MPITRSSKRPLVLRRLAEPVRDQQAVLALAYEHLVRHATLLAATTETRPDDTTHYATASHIATESTE
ncbi:MAG: hypothetical protein U0792_15980 [Gemmataceae bacterium]